MFFGFDDAGIRGGDREHHGSILTGRGEREVVAIERQERRAERNRV